MRLSKMMIMIPFLFSGAGLLVSQERTVLSLKQSIDLALKQNRTLSASREKLEEARARVGEARTGFLPKLTGSANYTRLDVAPFMPGDVFSEGFPSIPGMPPMDLPKRITIGRNEIVGIGVQLQQPLFSGFRIVNGFRMAKEGLNASEAELMKESNDLILQVEEAYWSVVKAQKFVEVAQEATKQVEGHVTDLENMYDVGMITKNDLLKARVQLSNTKLMAIQAENGVQLSKKALCNLLGIPLDSELQLVEELGYDPVAGVTLEEANLQALNDRPEMRLFRASEAISKRAVDIVSGGYLPTVAVVADYAYQKPDRRYDPKFYTTWSFSVVASLTLFDWGENHYKKAQAQRQLAQIREQFESVKNGIQLEVTQAVLKLKEAEERIRVAQENVKQAEENYKVTEDLFHQGMATNTDFLDANTLLTQAKTDYISALADYKLAIAQLQKATGIIGKGE